jgi:Probable Zinc-ribbon domain
MPNHKKSFASHPRSANWGKSNLLKPDQVAYQSARKAEFVCDVCGHLFYTQVYIVSNGHWCPYCAHKKLCTDETCYECFKNSFASHPKSAYLTKNGPIPRQVTLKSSKILTFKCDKCCHEFQYRTSSVTRGAWCPRCRGASLRKRRVSGNHLLYKTDKLIHNDRATIPTIPEFPAVRTLTTEQQFAEQQHNVRATIHRATIHSNNFQLQLPDPSLRIWAFIQDLHAGPSQEDESDTEDEMEYPSPDDQRKLTSASDENYYPVPCQKKSNI